MSLMGTAIPVPLVPVVGSLLDDGYGAEVFLTLAAMVAFAGILNLRPVEGSSRRAEPRASRRSRAAQ